MAETQDYQGSFSNESTATVQDIHTEYEVELIEVGLLSDTLCKIVVNGSVENLNELLTVVADPRNPPNVEPEVPEEIPEEPEPETPN